MKDKNFFISRFLGDVIFPLGDKAYQERVWAEGIGPEVDSYDEAINNFYYFFRILEDEYINRGLSKEEFKLLVELKRKIDEHSDRVPIGSRDRDIIAHPSWNNVIEAAQALSKALSRFTDKD